MQNFIFGIMIGIASIYLFKIPIRQSLLIYTCLYFSFLHTLIQKTSDHYSFISNSALIYSIPFIALFVNKIPYIDNPNEKFKTISFAIIFYISSIIGLNFFIHIFPVNNKINLLISIILTSSLIIFLNFKIRFTEESERNKKLIFSLSISSIVASILIHIFIFLNQYESTEYYETTALALLLFAQCLAIQLLPNLKRTSTLNKQVLTLDKLKEWLATNRKIKDFSHDLRQPLSTISVISGVGKAMADRDDMRDRFQHILTAHASFNSMLNHFLDDLHSDLRRLVIDTSVEHSKIVRCDLNEHLTRLYNEYQYFARAKGLSLRLKNTRLDVYSDPKALDKILRNGLDNAIKYTTQGGIVMGVRQEWKAKKKNTITIQIIDTGSGIDNQVTPTHHKGWGYGSTIIQNLSKLANAKVSVSNRKGAASGTCFNMVLANQKNYKPPHLEFNHADLKPPPIVILNTVHTALELIESPKEYVFETLLYERFEQIKEKEKQHPHIFFYTAMARNLEEIEFFHALARQYETKFKNKMTLIIGVHDTLLSQFDQDNFSYLVFSNTSGKEHEFKITLLSQILNDEECDTKFCLNKNYPQANNKSAVA